MKKTKYLIIGNGIAGLAAAKEIRKQDLDGSITMISNEPYLSYYRIRLTELIYKDFTEEGILINKEDWYRENKIEVLLNKIVEKIDVDKSSIRIDDGREIQYEKLLIATGSRPFIPPVEGKFKQGVLALRNIKDLEYIKNYLEGKENVTVIGGGLLGLEAAWALKQLGKKVSVVEFAPYLLPRQLDKELSKKLQKRLEEEGFKFYLNVGAEKILGENVADGIKLNNGEEIETEAILFSVGVRPNLDLVWDTEIKSDKGIIVDGNLRTNIPNIYAAGDVIEMDGRPIGLWTASNEQGKIAGQNMAGGGVEYKEASLYASLNISNLRLFSMGDINEYDQVYQDVDGKVHKKLFVKDNKISAGILFGDTKDMGKLKTAIENKLAIEKYLKDSPEYNKK